MLRLGMGVVSSSYIFDYSVEVGKFSSILDFFGLLFPKFSAQSDGLAWLRGKGVISVRGTDGKAFFPEFMLVYIFRAQVMTRE